MWMKNNVFLQNNHESTSTLDKKELGCSEIILEEFFRKKKNQLTKKMQLKAVVREKVLFPTDQK